MKVSGIIGYCIGLIFNCTSLNVEIFCFYWCLILKIPNLEHIITYLLSLECAVYLLFCGRLSCVYLFLVTIWTG
jgi:hypothetical protein